MFLEEIGFDPDQFAYLECRSAVQANLIVVEQLKRARQQKKKVGAIFFDFTDAFGTVDRLKLLRKQGVHHLRGVQFTDFTDKLLT